MNEIPEEYELMSFFEVEPIKLDADVPYYYNQLTYILTNDTEKIEFHFSPAYGDIEIFWIQNNNLRFNWRLYDIESVKIEKKDGVECMQIVFNTDNIADCFIWVKPYFKIIGGMNIIH